jgi:DNA adenine methylase
MAMTAFALLPPSPRRLIHFTPLRYPGGKGKMAAYVKSLIKQNKLLDGEYVEPYAGGAAIALELLFHEYVSLIHINDISRPVHAFWSSVLNNTEQLCRRIRDTELTIKARDNQKIIFANQDDFDEIDVGFAAFFLNRVNRSGILNGGVIGGRDQTGPWKIDARYNHEELIFRIEAIAKMRRRIELSHMDAVEFMRCNTSRWPAKTLIYLDPPYYEKGRELYYDFYNHSDHAEVGKFVAGNLTERFWIVSYDDAPVIRDFYKGYRWRTYKIGYSARERREGSEIMFFGDALHISPLVGPVTVIGGSHMGEQDDQYSPEEAARRSDEVLRHMLGRPPQPHATHRPGQARSRKPAASDRARRATGKAPVRDNT